MPSDDDGGALRGLEQLARVAVTAMVSDYVRIYHRHDLTVDAPLPDEPALIVANHGFGGVFDLNVLALVRTLAELGIDESTTYLVHDLAWTLGAGPIIERLGGAPGSAEAVRDAFAARRHVAVFPGGDVEAGKPTSERNRIKLDGREGFARAAMEHDVPIVPVVTAGAGESLLVLSDGAGLARALDLPRLLRLKTLPVSVSLPWGLNVGVVGLAPYLPLPTKLATAVLPPMRSRDQETPSAFAARVAAAMQRRLDELVRRRRPLIG